VGFAFTYILSLIWVSFQLKRAHCWREKGSIQPRLGGIGVSLVAEVILTMGAPFIIGYWLPFSAKSFISRVGRDR